MFKKKIFLLIAIIGAVSILAAGMIGILSIFERQSVEGGPKVSGDVAIAMTKAFSFPSKNSGFPDQDSILLFVDQRLVQLSRNGGEILSLNSNSEAPFATPGNLFYEGEAQVSPNQKMVLWDVDSSDKKNSALVLTDLTMQESLKVLETSSGFEIKSFIWSPDSKSALIDVKGTKKGFNALKFITGKKRDSRTIFKVDFTTGTVQEFNLPTGDARFHLNFLKWDKNKIYWDPRRSDGKSGIFVMDTLTNKVRTIVNNEYSDINMIRESGGTKSPNLDKKVFVDAESDQIVIKDITTQNEERVNFPENRHIFSNYSKFIWSSDERKIAFILSDLDKKVYYIYSYDLESNEMNENITVKNLDRPNDLKLLAWSGNGIVYKMRMVTRDSDKRSTFVYFFDFSNNKNYELGRYFTAHYVGSLNKE